MAPCTVIRYGAPVIEHPPDPRLLEGWSLEPGSYYLSVCRLEPENHVLELIDGFRRSGSRRQFAIVGDPRGAKQYVRRLLRQAPGRQIRFIGAVYELERLQALRYHALAYLHGHSVGGTNPSLLEALGCGNVVVAHDNEFNREVCGDVAFYFATANEVARAIATVEVLKPSERSTLTERARAIVRERYCWEDIADRYVSLLRA
jgi:glycosyltransferase involved in cell wall biosynthesis